MLRFANPDWVLLLARGSRWMYWGIIAGFLAGFFGRLLPPILGIWSTGVVQLRGLLLLPFELVGVIGILMLTSRDPGGVDEDGDWSLRRFVRIVVVTGFVCDAVSNLLEVGVTNSWIVVWIQTGFEWCALATLIAIAFSKFLFIERLANRLPDAAIERRARLLRWVLSTLAVVALVTTVSFSFSLTTTPTTAPAVSAPPVSSSAGNTFSGSVGLQTTANFGGAGTTVAAIMMIIGTITSIAAVVFWFITLRLIAKLGAQLRKQAQLAAETWAAA